METAYPAVYEAAEVASRRGQLAYIWLTRIELALMLVAATLATSRVLHVPAPVPYPLAVALCLLIAMALRLANRLRRPDKAWFDGRAVAESVKSATWRYGMGLEPFGDDEKTDARQTLVRTIDDALRSRPDLVPGLEIDARRPVVGAAVEQLRALDPLDRVQRYIRERLDNQIDWYQSKSKQNRHSAATWFWLGLAFQVLAVGAAVVAIYADPLFALVGLLTALTAATTASAQLGRDDELGRSYGLAAAELSQIRLAMAARVDAGAEAFDLVRDAEGAISREHTMWVAKRT